MTDIKKAQSLCQTWILNGFPGSKVLAAATHHFAAESAAGELCIYELRFPGVAAKWPTKLFEKKKLKDAWVRATLRKKNTLCAVIQVQADEGEGLRFRFDPHAPKLHWVHVYPDEPLPELEIVKKSVTMSKEDVVVTHKMRGFGLTQVHSYALRLVDVSAKLCASIREHGNYPCVVPHSHTIMDGEVVIYDRKIEHWAEHAATRDAYTGSVRRLSCVSCSGSFFGFVGEDRCRGCQSVVSNDAVKIKKKLIKETEKYAQSSDWREISAVMRDLMEQWRKAPRASREQDDALWQEFNAARQVFFDRQSKFFGR